MACTKSTWVLSPGHNSFKTTEDMLNRHSFWLGAAAQSDADVSPELGPPQADLLTAQHLGARVANVARQMAAGRLVLE
ncbi:UNVERIFIED_ORG: hypothetical protein J2W87_004584 [Pseudomonas putida]|nr:hypothetical protein [Pseudomonas putida]